MWTILLIIAAFVAWHFLPQSEINRPSPKFRRENRARASDPHWIRLFEEHCESPAEVAFLRIMIDAYDLCPDLGMLYGKGLRLDFQVEEGRYRLDFLANHWLVIEIDGAAYHSSPEAVARDGERNRYLESIGYTVLRIPAKVVFNKADEAIQSVAAALEVGKRLLPTPIQKSGWQRLADTANSISNAVAEINTSIDEARAVQAALAEAKSAFSAEKTMIQAAIESSLTTLKTEDWLSTADDRTRDIYETSSAHYEKLFSEEIDLLKNEISHTFQFKRFPPAPAMNLGSTHAVAIQNSYLQLANQRRAFLTEQILTLAVDKRLPELVKQKLKEYGCADYWQALRDT